MPDAGLWALIKPWARAAAELLHPVKPTPGLTGAPVRSAWTGEGARPHTILPLPLQRPVERLVKRCFGFLVLRGRDLALFSFHFELEQFFLQRFEQ